MNATRRRGLVSVIAMMAMFGVVLSGPVQVAAQGDQADMTFDFKNLEGFQRGAARTYMGDLSALYAGLGAASTPGADVPTPDYSQLGLFLLEGFAVQFDSGDHASASFDTLTGQISQGALDDETFALKETQIDTIGDKTKAYAGSYADSGIQGTADLVLVQKGEFLYASIAVSFGSDPIDVTKSFLSDMTNNKPGDGDGTFKDDGTSTGGLWDIFPSADADYLKGLTPAADQDLSQSEE